MSFMVVDPLTYTVPEGQALLYTVLENEATVIKYKLNSGLVGNASLQIIKKLGVSISDLTCLVYEADLLDSIASDFSSTDSVTIASESKAIPQYLEHIADQKVNKSAFLSTIAQLSLPNAIEYLPSLPTPTSEILGKTVVYVGPTTQALKKGRIYRCEQGETRVVVSNAGSDIVNGTYTATGESINGEPIYSMSKDDVTMYYYRTSNDYEYKIASEVFDGNNNNGDAQYFYVYGEWNVGYNGEGPAPSVEIQTTKMWVDITGISELEDEIRNYEAVALSVIGQFEDFEAAANAIIGE